MNCHLRWTVAALLVAVVSVAQAQAPGGGRPGGPGGGPGGYGGRGGMGGAMGGVMLLAIPEVQQELKITDDQKKELEKVGTSMREEMMSSFAGGRPDFQSLSEEERTKLREEMTKKNAAMETKVDAELKKVFKPEQLERFSQLKLQREGSAALARADIASKLGLSDEQKEKLTKLQEASRPGQGGGFGNFRDMSEEDRQKAFTKMREQREKADADMVAVLTTEQQETFKKLKGAEFKFPQGGGFGGFGGAGGGGRGGAGGAGGGGERQRPAKKAG